MVPKAPTKPKRVLYYKSGWLRKKIGPFLVWGKVGFSEGLTDWVSTTWTCWWTAPCRSMTRRWVTRSLPSQRSMRGKLRAGRPPKLLHEPPTARDHLDGPGAASPTAKSKIRSSERNIALDINNHLRSIDLFRSMIN